MARITNSFENGMSTDLDEKLRSKSSFTLGVNGRLVYNQDGSFSFQKVLKVADRSWNFKCYSSPNFISSKTSFFPQFILLSCNISTFSACYFIRNITLQKNQVEALVTQRTEELSIQKTKAEAI